jgi:hypothetical protein
LPLRGYADPAPAARPAPRSDAARGISAEIGLAPLVATCGEDRAGPNAPARRRTGGSRSGSRTDGLSDRDNHGRSGTPAR